MALYSQYNFDEGTGAIAADSSGNNNNLTVNAGGWSSDGHAGAALVSSESYAATGSVLPNGATFSWMCWFMPTALGDRWQSILQIGETYFVEHLNGLVDIFFDGGGKFHIPDVVTVEAGVWYHLAFVCDAATLTATSYVNGVQTNQVSTNANVINWAAAGTTYICGAPGMGLGFMKVDDMRAFDTALTQAEIVTYMNTSASVAGPVSAGGDQIVSPWATVTLEGAGGSAAGVWTQVSGPSVTLLPVNPTTVSFVARPADTQSAEVERVFRYTVASESDDILVTTSPSKWFYFNDSGSTKPLRIKSTL